MSAAYQEPGLAGLAHVPQADPVLGEESHYDGGNAPGREAVRLRELMDDRLLDALAERSRDEAGGLQLTGEGSMLGELVKAVLERALEAELTAHLGYGKRDPAGHNSGNSRNGMIRSSPTGRQRPAPRVR